MCGIITHMTTRAAHLAQFEDFRKGAHLEANPPPLRVESMFLALFHLIDACAAGKNVHIDKHKNVRRELEANPTIFGPRTREVWAEFQDIELRLRPKFVYGRSWQPADLDAVFRKAARIEAICREVLP